MVLIREFEASSDEWRREFFCETWTSPQQRWRLVDLDGDCYLDHGIVLV